MIKDQPYECSLVCNQIGSAYYQMAKSEFMRIFKANQEVWKMLVKQAKVKVEKQHASCNQFLQIRQKQSYREKKKPIDLRQNNPLLD